MKERVMRVNVLKWNTLYESESFHFQNRVLANILLLYQKDTKPLFRPLFNSWTDYMLKTAEFKFQLGSNLPTYF